MRRHALFVLLAAGLAAAVAGCKTPGPDPTDATAVAKAYHAYLRDKKVEQARALATFEDDNARKVWEEQVQDYVDRREAGGRRWWGEVFQVSSASGPEPGEWAVAEVQWHYYSGPGWQMSQWKYTYPMRTVDGEWRMVIDNQRIEQNVPFFPPDEP